MKKILALFILILVFLSSKNATAQYNYVPNPSFEEYDSIPYYLSDSTIYDYLFFPTHWFIPVECKFAYYFNTKLNYVDTIGGGDGISWYGVPQNPWGYTEPYDGIAQSGVVPFTVMTIEYAQGYRDYLEVRLLKPLTSGYKYCVNFFVTLEDSAYIAIDQIGAYFSNDSLFYYDEQMFPHCYLLENPQIVNHAGNYLGERNKWYNISGVFTAQGGEQFMTIGNFKVDSNTNFLRLPDTSLFYPGSAYHIDMVSVIECDTNIRNAFAGKDTTICLGDSIRIGTNDTIKGNYDFLWSPTIGLNDTNVQNPYAKPEQTTSYQLMQSYYNSYYTSDVITITVIDCFVPPPDTNTEIKQVFYIPNIFSPNSDGNNDILFVRGENISVVSISIYNRWGEKVFESNDIFKGWDGNYKGKPCPAEVYVYSCNVTFLNGEIKKTGGNITLVR
jgi:gliding motility-associated-like protein